MANKVNFSPPLPAPASLKNVQDVQSFLTNLIQTLANEFRDHANRLNNASPEDGTEIPTAPVRLKIYLKASLPSASTFPFGLIYVGDDVGGATPAFSDGVNWRRVADRNVIS